jgi:hypothetical protein
LYGRPLRWDIIKAAAESLSTSPVREVDMRFTHTSRLHPVIGAIVLLLAVSCLFDDEDVDCLCTADFAMVTFTVVDSTGAPQTGFDVTVTNLRTNKVLDVSQPQELNDMGVYVVLDDSYRSSIPEDGEHLRVAGTRNAEEFENMYHIGVDLPCRCHIRKLGGPGTITIN